MRKLPPLPPDHIIAANLDAATPASAVLKQPKRPPGRSASGRRRVTRASPGGSGSTGGPLPSTFDDLGESGYPRHPVHRFGRRPR